jgi:hypothetical protein
VGPRAGMDDVEKRKFLTLPGLEPRPLGRLSRSQSLYRLSYPGSCQWLKSLRRRICRPKKDEMFIIVTFNNTRISFFLLLVGWD